MKHKAYITRDEYQAIKNTGLNFKEISQKHLTKDELKHLKFQKVLGLKASEGGSFANYSSFAHWHDQGGDVLKAQEKSLKLIQDWDILQSLGVNLRADRVFLGVNAGAKGFDIKKEAGSETFDHFEMFQLRTIPGENGERDGIPCAFKYQRAFVNYDQEHKDFYNEHIRGAYITDFVKGMPTDYGNEIEKLLKAVQADLNYTDQEYDDLFKRFAKLFGEILKNELKALGDRTHTLIVMGFEGCVVNKLIKESGLDKKYNIKNVPHYSGTPKYEDLRVILKEIVGQ